LFFIGVITQFAPNLPDSPKRTESLAEDRYDVLVRWLAGVLGFAGACSRPAAVVHDASVDIDAQGDAPIDAPGDAPIDPAPDGIITGDPHTPVECLVVDATSVYYGVGFVPSYVKKAPLQIGAQSTMLAMDAVENACPMALDATNVYWINGMGQTHGVPLGGGSISSWGFGSLGFVASNGDDVVTTFLNTGPELDVTVRTSGVSSQIEPGILGLGEVAADATYVYFAARLPADGPGFGNMVARVPLNSGFNPTPEVLYTAPSGYVIGQSGYYGAALGVARHSFAIDATNLYLIESMTGSSDLPGDVVQVPLVGGGAPIVLAHDEPGVLSMAIDATDVYWSSLDGSPAAIKHVPISGGAMPVTVTHDSSGAFAVGPTVIVWSSPGIIHVVTKP